MWCLVLDADTGVIITNASFSISYYNRGDGNYYVYFSDWNQAYTRGAPAYDTLWGNNDYYNGITIWLRKTPPPTPSPSCSCWS